MSRVINKTIKKTATPRTGRLIDATSSKGGAAALSGGGGLSHSHANKALIDLINQGLSTESSVQFKDVVASGAITAGAANGAIPDDLPAATDQVFGVVKIDGVTIKIDPETGKIYAEVSSGGVSSWNELTDIPQNLIAIAALTGAGLIKRNTDGTFNLDTTVYQTYDSDLATIAAIADGIGFLRRTGQNTWIIDTNTYLTSITKAMVEAVLTGDITSHTHSQYLTGITKGMVEAVLTGLITTHTHNYLPINSGAATSNAGLVPNGLQYVSSASHTFGGDLPTTAEGTIANFNGNSTTSQSLGFKLMVPTSVNKSLFYESNYGGTWRGWTKLFDTKNSNLKTVDWYAKNLYGINGYFEGACTAGAANATPPDDLPVATTTLFGVAKYTGLAIQPTAGDVVLRSKHYTSPTANSWVNKAYTITYEVGLSSPGSLGAGAYYSSLFLYALPTTKCLACVVSAIPYATGTTPPWIGHQLIVSATKDTTNSCWRVFIYNPTALAVDLTSVKLSIIAQMIE